MKELDEAIQKAIAIYGKVLLLAFIKALIALDKKDEDRLFRIALELQARHHGIRKKELLKSKKAAIVQTRHLMLYVFSNIGWSTATLKRLFGIQRNEWVLRIIEEMDNRLQLRYPDTMQEHERIVSSLHQLHQVFHQNQ